MREYGVFDYPYAVCCPCCGTILSRSFQGTKTLTHCSKCKAELYYEVGGSGPTVKVTKEPKSPPNVPAVPA